MFIQKILFQGVPSDLMTSSKNKKYLQIFVQLLYKCAKFHDLVICQSKVMKPYFVRFIVYIGKMYVWKCRLTYFKIAQNRWLCAFKREYLDLDMYTCM